jgi:ABC-type branched-subunit amino acid transport system substrate-binding protein
MKKVALLIGVSEYGNGFAPLPSTEKDVVAIYNVLVDLERGEFLKENIKCLINQEKYEIQQGIDWLFYDRQKNDLILFYFSGHGIKSETNELYLGMKNTHKDAQGDTILSSALNTNFLKNAMESSNSQRKVIILDSCYSGAIVKGTTWKGDDLLGNVENYLGKQGRVILTSSSSVQYSSAGKVNNDGSVGLSIYTQHLIDGIKGAADTNCQGWITTKELHDYVSKKVREVQSDMTPKFIPLDEGGDIKLTKCPIDPNLQYEKLFEEFAKEENGKIYELQRSILLEEQDKLGLSLEQIKIIEDRVLLQYIKYQENINKYEQELIKILNRSKRKVSKKEQRHLKRYAEKSLHLEDEDVSVIHNRLGYYPNRFDSFRELSVKLIPIILLAIIYPCSVLWLFNRKPEKSITIPTPTPSISTPNLSENPSSDRVVEMSVGDRHVDTYKSNIPKSSELNAHSLFKNPHYKDAYLAFQQLHKRDPKNPIWLIYMNNAKIRYWYEKPKDKKKFKNEEIYTIAAALPTNQERGQHILHGVAYAQSKAINSSSTSIKNSANNIELEPEFYLEIQVVDDNNDSDKTKAQAVAQAIAEKKFSDKDKKTRSILAVVGHYASEVTCAALPIYSQQGLPVISPTSKLSKLRTRCGDNHQVFYRTTSSSSFEAKALAKHLRDKQKSIGELNILAFYKKQNDDRVPEFSQDLFDNFKGGEFGKYITEEVDLSSDKTVQETISELNNGNMKPNVILLFPNGRVNDNNKSDSFNNAMSVLENTKIESISLILASNPMLTGDPNYASNLAKWNQKLVVAVDWHGVKSTVPNTNDPDSCGNIAYVEEIHDLWGGDLDRTTAQSYEAVQFLSRIIREGSNTRSTILERLSQEKNIESHVFKTIKNISFDSNGNREQITSRILLNPYRVNSSPITIKFKTIDHNQCK